jgi:large-conductance mechanosensitive channel
MASNEPVISHRKVIAGSNRSFGVVFAVVFALLGLTVHAGWLAVAAAFAAVAFLAPAWLARLNRLWFRFGILLHHVVNPIVMGFLFFVVILPIALLMRAFGKDPLRLKRDAQASTYWIAREPPGPAPGSMRKQF